MKAMARTPDYFIGKTIIITGAASGIGPATALIFAREGANVICADINEKGADETAAEVNRIGSRALAIEVDVTKRTEVDDMAERAFAAFGRVQFLFNSAGAAIRRATFLEIDDALMEKTFALNVNGTLYCMQALLPHMLAGQHGVIVNMASMAHRRGGPGLVNPLRGGQRRGGIDDARRCPRIRDARHPRAVDFPRAGQNAFSGRSAILARAD
jgi:3-oxoacyl-[acyl-carrier protein] reductase